MDLSISIVSYNQLTNLSKCIASLQKYIEGISYEIIVVAYRFTPGKPARSAEDVSRSGNLLRAMRSGVLRKIKILH